MKLDEARLKIKRLLLCQDGITKEDLESILFSIDYARHHIDKEMEGE